MVEAGRAESGVHSGLRTVKVVSPGIQVNIAYLLSDMTVSVTNKGMDFKTPCYPCGAMDVCECIIN